MSMINEEFIPERWIGETIKDMTILNGNLYISFMDDEAPTLSIPLATREDRKIFINYLPIKDENI